MRRMDEIPFGSLHLGHTTIPGARIVSSGFVPAGFGLNERIASMCLETPTFQMGSAAQSKHKAKPAQTVSPMKVSAGLRTGKATVANVGRSSKGSWDQCTPAKDGPDDVHGFLFGQPHAGRAPPTRAQSSQNLYQQDLPSSAFAPGIPSGPVGARAKRAMPTSTPMERPLEAWNFVHASVPAPVPVAAAAPFVFSVSGFTGQSVPVPTFMSVPPPPAPSMAAQPSTASVPSFAMGSKKPPGMRRNATLKSSTGLRSQSSPTQPVPLPSVFDSGSSFGIPTPYVSPPSVFSFGNNEDPTRSVFSLSGPSSAQSLFLSAADKGYISTRPDGGPKQTTESNNAGALKAAMSAARERFKEGDFAGAKKLFGDALSLQPLNPGALGNRAAACIMLGEYTSALEDTQLAINTDPWYAPAYCRRARAFLALGQAQDALTCLQDIVDRSNSGSVGVLGMESKHGKDLKSAKELLESLACSLGHVDTAASNLRKKRIIQAHGDLLEARSALSEIERCFAYARVAIVDFCSTDSAYAEAAETFTAVLPAALEGTNDRLADQTSATVCKTAVELAVLVSWSAWGAEDPDKAQRILAAVLRASPQHFSAQILSRRLDAVERNRRQGNQAFGRGNWSDAVVGYEAALQSLSMGGHLVDQRTGVPLLVPMVAATLHSNKAAALSADGRHGAAIIAASAALASWPGHVKALLRRARARCATEEWTRATEDFKAVLAAIKSGQSGAGKGGRTDATVADIAQELANVAIKERVAAARAAEERRKKQQSYARNFFEGFQHPYATEDESFGEEDDGWGASGRGRGHGGADYTRGPSRGGHGASGHGSRASHRAPPPPPPRPADHLAVLGVQARSTQEVLKAAYRKAALRTHPDKQGGSEEAFKAVNEAFTVLSDSTKTQQWGEDLRKWDRSYGQGRR